MYELKNDQTTLGALLLKTVGAGYSALNIAGRQENLKIFEFSTLGSEAQLLILGTDEDVSSFILNLRTSDIHRTIQISKINEKILNSYLNIETHTPEKYLLIIESRFIGDLFYCAHIFDKLGLGICDFRIFRTTGSPAHLILTGDDPDKIKSVTTELKLKGFKMTFIQNLSKGLKSYFTFED